MAFSLTSSALSLLVPLLLLLLHPPLTLSASMLANFTTSYYDLTHSLGAFLFATNFKAVITSNIACLAVVHSDSGTIVWSAYPSCPSSATIHFSGTGILVQDGDGKPLWSTPPFSSPVYLVELEESGNPVLRNQFNRSLWESFDNPTDTIVIGQRLPAGHSLVSAVSITNLSMGDYQFSFTSNGGGDAVTTWNGMTYWQLSTEPSVFMLSNGPASYMVLNETGLYSFGANGSVVVLMLALGMTEFRIAKLEYNGIFSISRYSYQSSKWDTEFSSTVYDCRIPDICGRIGVCSTSRAPTICSCPPGFKPFNVGNQKNGFCSPVNDSYYLPSACNASGDGELKIPTSYMKLEDGADYFFNFFSKPLVRDVNLSACEDLCSLKCSCLGFFHDNYSGSCSLLENYLGSIIANTTTDQKGYIKVGVSTFAGPYLKNYSKRNQHFPISGLVLLPSSGFLLIVLVMVGIVWYRKRKSRNSLIELETDGIPGLTVRFGYKELVAATKNFGTQIGSGGCGIVYKGMLPDESIVAVKKITSLGVQGKKEFCTEITIIGNVRHVNLVRLKGFCTRGKQRFLVYEYVNRGSLDQMLFGNGYVLEWEERFKIALSTARGLAYLHNGCDPKIIHCDVKPENILLDDNLQVKISDFGISKLLSREQSGLFSTIRGTRGYIAPDWFTNSTITDKSDVYSYGMVLLEIVRGGKNRSLQIHNGNTENDQSSLDHSVFFPQFALEMHKQRRYLELVDSRLEGRVTSKEEVEKLIRVALCCVHQDPALRPSMANVVGMLEGRYPLGVPRAESLNFLPFHTSPQAPRIEAHNVLAPQANANSNRRSVSYMSSQQVSGPR